MLDWSGAEVVGCLDSTRIFCQVHNWESRWQVCAGTAHTSCAFGGKAADARGWRGWAGGEGLAGAGLGAVAQAGGVDNLEVGAVQLLELVQVVVVPAG